MTNLLIKRTAWLRAVQILAVVCTLFSAIHYESKAQECDCSTDFVNCLPWSEERKEIVFLNAMPGCPVIVTYKVRQCEYLYNGNYYTSMEICFSKIENKELCCVAQFEAWQTNLPYGGIPTLVSEVSDAFVQLNLQPVFKTRISKPACWRWNASNNSYDSCPDFTTCCYVEIPPNGTSASTGPTPVDNCQNPLNPCGEFVCP